jgi:DNA polymerase-3 subunit beta
MNKQLKTIKTNKVLFILENIAVVNNRAMYTNLETTIEWDVDLPDGLYNKKMFENGIFLKDVKEDVADYPIKPTLNSPSTIFFDREDIEHIGQAVKFVGKDMLRPVMTGVYVGINGICGTDAHRLYYNESTLFGNEMVLSPEVCKLLQFYSDVNVSSDGQHVVINDIHSTVTITSRLIDGKYPNFMAVIPKDNPFNLTANKKDVLAALKILSLFANKTTNQVVLSINNSTLTLECADLDRDIAKTIELPCKSNAGEYKFALNYKFFELSLKCIDDKEFTLDFSEPRRSVLLNKNYLLMPLMLNR